jgi:hypothetical protein
MHHRNFNLNLKLLLYFLSSILLVNTIIYIILITIVTININITYINTIIINNNYLKFTRHFVVVCVGHISDK